MECNVHIPITNKINKQKFSKYPMRNVFDILNDKSTPAAQEIQVLTKNYKLLL